MREGRKTLPGVGEIVGDIIPDGRRSFIRPALGVEVPESPVVESVVEVKAKGEPVQRVEPKVVVNRRRAMISTPAETAAAVAKLRQEMGL